MRANKTFNIQIFIGEILIEKAREKLKKIEIAFNVSRGSCEAEKLFFSMGLSKNRLKP